MSTAELTATLGDSRTECARRFRELFHGRRLVFVGDFCVASLWLLAIEVFAGSTGSTESSRAIVLAFPVLWLLWFGATRVFSHNRTGVLVRTPGETDRLVASALATASVLMWSPLSIPGAFVTNAICLVAVLVVWRRMCPRLFRPLLRSRTLILGRTRATSAVRQVLQTTAKDWYDVVAALNQHGAAVLQHRQQWIAYVQDNEIRQIVVDPTLTYPPEIEAAFQLLGRAGVRIHRAGDLYESLTGKTLLASGSAGPAQNHSADISEALRRIAELSITVLALALVLPIMLLAGLAILLDSPGSPLYWQPRVGQHGRTFHMLKLRTMRVHAEGSGRPVWARHRDPRVTRVGAVLRRSHLDELPQLWNVLKGDMSLIGPRPERPEFVALLNRRVPLYRARHTVKPGITGWAQVQVGYAASVKDATTKLQYDLYYIRHRTPLLEAIILLRTIAAVLLLEGC